MNGKELLKGWIEKGKKLAGQYKFVLLIGALGLVLLLWPGGERKSGELTTGAPAAVQEDFSVSALEEKLSKTLSKVSGAGDVTVMLTVQGGARQILAQDEEISQDNGGGEKTRRSTVVVSGGSGSGEGAVPIQQLYPKFQGALIVCDGGADASVRLKLMEAVSALTGLGADKISICKGKG